MKASANERSYPSPASAVGNAAPLTVSQVTRLVKRALESTVPSTLHVAGEISNLKNHAGGHLYFTLKDQACELSCVMWRSDAGRMKFEPQNGMEVVATGSIEVFERAGRYQLYVRRVDPRGVGALDLAFRQLREKLEKQGFFEIGRKRPIPHFPRCLALVTSPTGAAIEDILRTLQRRFPCVRVLIFPTRVQGEGAAGEIADAIRGANAHAAELGGIDAMIVGRGGGSLEDLWAFNEEVVARAIFQSKIPVISAVGHEVDVTIADLVADLRAATPTAAAELAVPLLDELQDQLGAIALRLHRRLRGRLEIDTSRLRSASAHSFLREPLSLVRRPAQSLDEWNSRILLRLAEAAGKARRRIDRGEALVARIAPHGFLRKANAALVASVQELQRSADRLTVRCERPVESSLRRMERAALPARVAAANLRTGVAQDRLKTAARTRLDALTNRLAAQGALLAAVSHERVLARGFSITRTKKGRRILRSVREIADGDRLVTQLGDGEFETQAVNNQQRELFE